MKTYSKNNFLRLVPFLLLFVILASASAFYLENKQAETESGEEIHYHAGFKVYVDGTLQDFSDFKYMHLSPCSGDGKKGEKRSPREIQLDRAHLHDGNGDVVHVHEKGAIWGDLFKNIGFTLPDKELKAWINGKEIEDVLSYEITPFDSLIITLGDTKGVDMNQYITYDRIREVEQKSENCGVD